MEYNLTTLKGVTEKLYMTNKNRIGIVLKSNQNVQKKLEELNNYHNQQRALDTEIEGQLNIMYKISMQLQTKKQDIIAAFEKYNPDIERLDKALETLKSKSIDESLIQQSEESEYIYSNLHEEPSKDILTSDLNINFPTFSEEENK